MASFTVSISDAPPPPPFRVEAETFTIVQGFSVANNTNASEGKFLVANGAGQQIANYAFTAASGLYDLDLGYFDENDGAASLAVFVNGAEIDSWVWNQNLGTAVAAPAARTARSIDGVALETGDVIEIRGFQNAGEPLRTDYLDFTFVGTPGPDLAPPTVQSVSAPSVTVAGGTTATVTVTYADNVALDVSSIDVGDITVTGAGGPLTVTGVSVSPSGDGAPRTATYTVAALGGTWDVGDNGAFTVALAANEVFDTAGNAVAANAALASFTVSISDAPPPPPFRVEAETFTIVQGFSVANNTNASEGKFLVANGAGQQIANYAFTAASGLYDLDLGYFDENDGAASLAVFVNGAEIDSWVWNQNLGTAVAAPAARTARSIDGVALETGDVIEIRGFQNAGEPLRTDYLDFTFVDNLLI